jgi:hypothetical protein
LNLIDFKTKEIHTLEKKNAVTSNTISIRFISDYGLYKKYDLHQCTQDEYGNWYLTKQHGTEKLVNPMIVLPFITQENY